MYDMSYETTHSQLWFGPTIFSKSKNHILPNYEQMDLKEYQGMRLCTEKELANNVCCGAGCGAKAGRAWFAVGNLFCSIFQY